MTSPKLKELKISLNDNSLKDKLLDYVANEQNMTTRQLKDFVIQSMDIYSNTLGIEQGLAKDFIEALSCSNRAGERSACLFCGCRARLPTGL